MPDDGRAQQSTATSRRAPRLAPAALRQGRAMRRPRRDEPAAPGRAGAPPTARCPFVVPWPQQRQLPLLRAASSARESAAQAARERRGARRAGGGAGELNARTSRSSGGTEAPAAPAEAARRQREQQQQRHALTMGDAQPRGAGPSAAAHVESARAGGPQRQRRSLLLLLLLSAHSHLCRGTTITIVSRHRQQGRHHPPTARPAARAPRAARAGSRA